MGAVCERDLGRTAQLRNLSRGWGVAEGTRMPLRDGLLAEGVFDLVEQALVVAVGLRVWRAKDLGKLLE